jgi:hypothetical protein
MIAPMRCVLVGVILVIGCHRTPPTVTDAGAPADAGPKDAAVAIVPFTGRVVARSVGVEMELVRMKDDGLVVTSGPSVWTVAANGTLSRVGTVADSVALLAPGDDEMGGYDAQPTVLHTVSGTATNPFVKPSLTAAFEWKGNAWTKGTAPRPEWHPNHGEPFDAEETAGLPETHYWNQRNTSGSAVVWLGYKRANDWRSPHLDEMVFAPAPNQPYKFVAFPKEHEKPTTYRSCDFLESGDKRSYVTCVSSSGDDDYVHEIYVLDGDHWTTTGFKFPKSDTRAIDSEGALWYVGGGNPPPTWLVRVTRDGKEERFDPPTAPAELQAPGYRSEDIPIQLDGPGVSDTKHWLATTILDSVPPKPMGWIYSLIPRRSGEMWAVGRDSGSVEAGSSIVRYSRTTAEIKPTLIRSSADEHNAVQQARGIRTWGGRCISAFIPFPHGTAFYGEHKADIEKAVALTDRKGGKTAAPFDIAIVEGHVDARAVSGALIIRSDPDADEKRMTAAVQKLTEIATLDPASSPAVTCSMPTLDRIVERLRTAKPERY